MKASGALHSKALVLAGKASKRGCLFLRSYKSNKPHRKKYFHFFS